MTRSEAIEIATRYAEQHLPYVLHTAESAFYIKAEYVPETDANDAWVVHFPLILPDEVECQEPSTAGILVDIVTREIKVARLL